MTQASSPDPDRLSEAVPAEPVPSETLPSPAMTRPPRAVEAAPLAGGPAAATLALRPSPGRAALEAEWARPIALALKLARAGRVTAAHVAPEPVSEPANGAPRSGDAPPTETRRDDAGRLEIALDDVARGLPALIAALRAAPAVRGMRIVLELTREGAPTEIMPLFGLGHGPM